MKIKDIIQMPQYFDRYIRYVPDDIHLGDALEQLGISSYTDVIDQLLELDNKVYSPDKWTVKQIMQHIIDAERIFAYRILRFARKDTTVLPGFDENAFAKEAPAANRTLEQLLREWSALRQSNKLMFDSFEEDEMYAEGQTFAGSASVLALGFTIVGHPLHHLAIIKERYFPLLNN
jgi:uncharacterized damage-inducible protein DinB